MIIVRIGRRSPPQWAIAIPALIATLCTGVCRAAPDEDQQADILALALPASAYLFTLAKRDKEGALQLTKSLGASAVTTLALNSVIDDTSPNGQSDDAFPSGHATIAFSAAAFIQERYGWKPGIPAYAVATYVGWLRIDTDDHDFADVAGGAVVGIVSSYLFTDAFDGNVEASVWVDGDAAGLRFRFRW